MKLPEFTQKFKEKGTEIKRIGNGFYKYKIEYVYCPEKKRTVKKSRQILGKITENEGFILSEKNELRRKSEQTPKVDSKTFGIYSVFSELMKDEIDSIIEIFGAEVAEKLLSFALFRWASQASIKRAAEYHRSDFCSEFWAKNALTEKSISKNLKFIGENRQLIVRWMQTLLKDLPENEQNFVLMDSTHQMSKSENLAVNQQGYNPDFDFDKQIRLMYLFSAQLKQPIYYRIINGNIPDVKSMSLCIKEIGLKEKTVFVADTGFFSTENVAQMEAENLQYIIPLHRNSNLIDLQPLKDAEFEKNLKYFIFEDRIIWYYAYENAGYQLITVLDEKLRVQEKRDYLKRIETHPEKYTKEGFDKKLHGFGTITFVYNVDIQDDTTNEKHKKGQKSAAKNPKSFEQKIYEIYKQRNEIEVMFDSYKNYLKADVSYMQNRYVLEGWLFANFVAMLAYYKLYVRLREAGLLSKHSPKDIIELAKSIIRLKINDIWFPAEITNKTVALFEKIKIAPLK